MLAAIALSGTLVQPASAHGGSDYRGGQLSAEPGHCVYGEVFQTHASHEITTHRRTCQFTEATWHAQYQEYYKVWPGDSWGTYCFKEGWHESPNIQNSFSMHYSWDIWTWCNNGVDVHVVITIDSRQDSWKENWGYVWPPMWRPATEHCHCP
ncbi:MAG: hypothetical protein M3450_06135 [Actinomycetota bacterium]|nr:hypothetical protein [Actinomycetota bacterium]